MFNNIRIAMRLKIIGAAMAALTLLLVVVGYSMVSHMSSVASEMYNKGLVGSKLLADGNNAVWDLRFGIANYPPATPENRKKILDGRPKLYDVLDESLKKYVALGLSTEQDVILKELLDAFHAYKAGAPKWFGLIDADKLQEAAEYRSAVTNAAGSAMVKNIKALNENQLKINEALEKSAAAATEQAHSLLIAIGIAALVIVAASILLLARAISRPLMQMQAEIEEVEKSSDFTRRVTVTGNNEISQTAISFNKLMSTMQTSLRQLLDSVDHVSRAAGMLSSSSDRLASGAVIQDSATTSMAAEVEQVTASIQSVSDSARNALDISTHSGELASQGRDVIQKTVDEIIQIAKTMQQASDVIGQLGQQSNEISSVVQVIKEVADQTNLLALNAAIEAARAGEQGRGFAVVADEVRKLAERTTQSTIEITKMVSTIQNSSSLAVSSMSAAVTQMDGGVVFAQQAGDAINQIKERATQVVNVVKEIASALAEQSSASDNIAVQVVNMARMTEASSSATGEIVTATQNLEKLAGLMSTVGGNFRI